MQKKLIKDILLFGELRLLTLNNIDLPWILNQVEVRYLQLKKTIQPACKQFVVLLRCLQFMVIIMCLDLLGCLGFMILLSCLQYVVLFKCLWFVVLFRRLQFGVSRAPVICDSFSWLLPTCLQFFFTQMLVVSIRHLSFVVSIRHLLLP
jgi:hypothetical protein